MRRIRPEALMGLALALALGCALAVAAAIAAPAAPAPATAAASAATAPTITRSAHVAFENCNAEHIVLSVTVPKRAFLPTDAVTVTVRLRNTGSTTCGSPVPGNVPRRGSALSVGPVGPSRSSCAPATGSTSTPVRACSTAPRKSVSAWARTARPRPSATWSQIAYRGSPPKPRHAPPGTYRLVVDGAVTVPVHPRPG